MNKNLVPDWVAEELEALADRAEAARTRWSGWVEPTSDEFIIEAWGDPEEPQPIVMDAPIGVGVIAEW